MFRLQVLKNGTWQYVFCYSAENNDIITTLDRNKALNKYALDFFAQKYANYSFRLIK